MKIACVVFLALPLLAQQTIPLLTNEKLDPGAPREQIEQRGKNGVSDRSITNVQRPDVTVYLPPKATATRTAIEICPGGGYQHLAIDKEGHDVARWLNTIGIAGVVLKYRLPGGAVFHMGPEVSLQHVSDAIRVALEDAEAAMQLTRDNAGKWNLNPGAVGMMGFSAGGHLAAMMGMVASAGSRPDFLVLGYPAIPANLEVTASTPRTFLVAADDDNTVNAAENAGRFFAALRAAKVPAELHIYSTGGHGFGILKTDKTSAAWPATLVAWLKEAHLD